MPAARFSAHSRDADMTLSVSLCPGADLEGFKNAVRMLLAEKIAPDGVMFAVGVGLFDGVSGKAPVVMLPRAVAAMVPHVVCHRDPERYALMYRLIWRVLHGEAGLVENPADPLVHRLEMIRKAIRRDLHKMHAFLRFRPSVTAAGGEKFVAWFEPDHFIVEATAGFFVERFRALVWSILTPVGSLHWDTKTLVVGPGGSKKDLPGADGFEAGWCEYYKSTFNPARVNKVAMRTKMAERYWRNMPETLAIPALIQGARERVKAMVETGAKEAERRNPDKAVAALAEPGPRSLDELNRIIAASAPLVPGATRAVLGEGPVNPAIAFVGEQPGDAEDLAGRPFVGPAGQLLDRALAAAGIERSEAYVTNAVKHFKFEARGKRRIHAKPTAGEVKHYRWWLLKELDFVQPRLVVALGATALLALAGKAMPLLASRGEIRFEKWRGFVTVHPSYLLRLPDEAAQREGYAAFLGDLRRIKELVVY